MYEIDERFFDAVGFSKEALLIWGFKSYDDEGGRWYVSRKDAHDFCVSIGCDPEMAEI